MPNASSGPVMTHVSVVFVEPTSFAIVDSDTARIVIVNPTANSPSSTVPSTIHG